MFNSPQDTCENTLELSGVYNTQSLQYGTLNLRLPNGATGEAPRWNAPNSEVHVFTVELTPAPISASEPFEPGAALSFYLLRLGDNANDTCTGVLNLVGASVLYQGLSSYIPLLAR